MNPSANPKERLEAGLAQLQVPHTAEQRDRLLAFVVLMQKWNKIFNLTAIRDTSTAVDLHLLDSLTLWPYIEGPRILDVGTGAGLPGIPLAIINPERKFVLLDSNGKKTRFVQQATIEIGLRNVEVITSRIENYKPGVRFETVLARAFANLTNFWRLAEPLIAPNGRVLAQKGQNPQQELEALRYLSVRVHRLRIPGISVERHLIELATG